MQLLKDEEGNNLDYRNNAALEAVWINNVVHQNKQDLNLETRFKLSFKLICHWELQLQAESI